MGYLWCKKLEQKIAFYGGKFRVGLAAGAVVCIEGMGWGVVFAVVVVCAGGAVGQSLFCTTTAFGGVLAWVVGGGGNWGGMFVIGTSGCP